MPLLLPFRRAGPAERAFQVALSLGLGGLALLIVAPFVLVVAVSFGDPTDWWAGRLVPDPRLYLDAERRYVYYLAVRYDYWPFLNGFDDLYGRRFGENETILAVDRVPPPAGPWRRRAMDGLECLKTLVPWTHASVLFSGWGYFQNGVSITAYSGLGEVAWKRHLKRRFGSLETVNARFKTAFLTTAHVQVPALPEANGPEGPRPDDPWTSEYRRFIESDLPPAWRAVRTGRRAYRAYLEGLPALGDLGGLDEGERLARLNAALGTAYASWNDIALEESAPAEPGPRAAWERYVRRILSPYYLRVDTDPAMAERYRNFLLERHGSLSEVGAKYGSVGGDLALPATLHAVGSSGTRFADWVAFARTAPLDRLHPYAPEHIWRRYLAGKYGSVERVNAAFGSSHASIGDVPWPQAEIDRLDWERNRWRYLSEMIFKNYRRAWTFVAVATPSLWNTARFVLLFTLLSVVVNGTAAYALSRFAVGPAQVLLVAFLALAAFPIEAQAVPNFVLLRDLGLLNTVWALVLPTALNGYYIYLMKGAFDGLPRAYFEEAQLEGAGDWRIFWHVALPMTRPMLAVVALYAVLWSYANFLWAVVVCQHRSEWTLPVMMFNLNSWGVATPLLGAVMVLAGVPPLLLFAFAHRTLQRSLALPRVHA